MPKNPTKLLPRVAAIHGQLKRAECECGNGKDKRGRDRPCYVHTADYQAWCWPCRVRWSHRRDAAKFIAPMDDVIPK